MKNNALNKFLTTLNANRQKPKPRFTKGDIIINVFNNLRIVAEVIEVEVYSELSKEAQDFYKYVGICTQQSFGQYTLRDLVNEHKTNPENLKYTRQRDIQKIDAKYDKVKPEVARVLYGKMVTGSKK